MPVFPDKNPRIKNDPGAVGASLALLPEQIVSAWQQLRPEQLPKSYRRINHVVVAGMGGSHLGADIARAVFADQLKVPATIVSDYNLPNWANQNTLIIVMSYSGTTEESLAIYRTARWRRLKILVITSGGKLAAQARADKIPCFLYEPRENPSRQPRLGIAYSLVAIIHAWSALGLIKLSPAARQTMVWSAREAIRKYGSTVPARKNLAKQLATGFYRRQPLLIGAEWTVGNLQTWSNQIHENAKTYATYDVLPDLQHHLLEGLRDRRISTRLTSVLINDADYHPRNKLRLQATKEILQRFGARPIIITPTGVNRLDRAIDVLALGGYVSWYLSILENIDPAPIPIVNEVKKRLAKK